MNRTKIEWADYTWNPVTGCSPVSEGCHNCYAAAIARRFKLPWGSPALYPARLNQPGLLKRPSKIFVCSMGDLFHPRLDSEFIEPIFDVMLDCQQHIFMVLTKRPARMKIEWEKYFNRNIPPDNIWLGISAENQSRFDSRIQSLSAIPTRFKFVSCEPLLGPIDVSAGLKTLSWIIAGPENGSGARPCNPEWIASIAEQSGMGGVAFFDKRKKFIRREFPYVPFTSK